MIRSTWGMQLPVHSSKEYKVFFVTGVHRIQSDMNLMFEEGMLHKDLIFTNISDVSQERVEVFLFSYIYEILTHHVFNFSVNLSVQRLSFKQQSRKI